MSKSLNGSSNPSSFFIFLLAYPSKFWTQRSLYSPGILLVIPSFHCIAVWITHCSLDKTGHPYSLSARTFPEYGVLTGLNGLEGSCSSFISWSAASRWNAASASSSSTGIIFHSACVLWRTTWASWNDYWLLLSLVELFVVLSAVGMRLHAVRTCW